MDELSYTAVMLQKIRDEIEAPFRAEIDRLRAERDVMRAALEPFAKCAAAYDGYEGDQVNYYRARRYVVDQLTVGDFRKARAALAPSPAGREG